MSDVTQILSEIEQGDPAAAEQLLPLIYNELRTLAAAKLAQEKPGQTLQATALVHEAYIRLVDVEKAQHWDSRRHFFAAAAEAMRRILVDSARARNSRKRNRDEFVLADVDDVIGRQFVDYLALNDALNRLKVLDERRCRIVELRFFAGLSIEEIAELFNVSDRTIKRDWEYARVWLYRELTRG